MPGPPARDRVRKGESMIWVEFRRRNSVGWVLAAVSLCMLPACARLVSSQVPQVSDGAAAQRDAEVAKLLAVLRDPNLANTHPKQVVQAIQRLGQMRAVEAIDDLVKLLTFARRLPWERSDIVVEIQPIIPGNRYPATSALYQIGRPALPALVKVIELNDVESVPSRNAIYAIQNIFRNNLGEGSKYLQAAARVSLSADSSERLSKAATRLGELAVQFRTTDK